LRDSSRAKHPKQGTHQVNRPINIKSELENKLFLFEQIPKCPFHTRTTSITSRTLQLHSLIHPLEYSSQSSGTIARGRCVHLRCEHFEINVILCSKRVSKGVKATAR